MYIYIYKYIYKYIYIKCSFALYWSFVLNSPITVHFSSLIPKTDVDIQSCHLLLDHTQLTLIHGPNIPGSDVILFFTATDFTVTIRNIHNCTSFPLWTSHFILSGAISNCSPVFSSSILNAFQPRGLIFCCHIFLCFLTVHGVLDARILDSGLPSPPPADHVLSELFTVTRSRSVVPRSRLRALLSYASPYTMTKPWSMRRNTFATDYLHSLFSSSLK